MRTSLRHVLSGAKRSLRGDFPRTASVAVAMVSPLSSGGGAFQGARQFSSAETVSSFKGGQLAPASSLRGTKRFYKEAVPVFNTDMEEWEVHLDGKTVKTPQRQVLSTPSEFLAMAVSQEWDAQEHYIEPSLMPLTGLVCAYRDQYPECLPSVTEELKRYLVTDTICFRAEKDTQRELYFQQVELWDPLIDWMRDSFGIVVGTADSVMLPVHGEDALERLDAVLNEMSDAELCALYSVTTVCKSLTIGLATVKRRITIDQAVEMARTEEEYQIKLWGMVEGGHDVDRAHIRVQLASASSFLWLQEF